MRRWAHGPIDGGEDQLEGGGVGLAGGAEGIRFLPSTFTLDSGTTSFLMETRFTAASLGELDTIVSAGGNLFVRAQAGKLRYGWSGESGGAWQNYYAEADLPTGDGPHALSIHYRYSASGTTLEVTLDGESLPPLTGALPMKVAPGAVNMFGFGNDVHPQAADRGITGTLHAARVAETDGAPGNVFEFQPRELTTDLLNVSFDGTVADGAYTAADGEVADGALSLRGGATVAGGQATIAGGEQAVAFVPTGSPFTAQDLDRGFVAEFEFTPGATQPNLSTLFALGGNLFVRYQNNELRYGWSSNTGGAWTDHIATTGLPAAGEAHIISVAYEPRAAGDAKMYLWIDGVAARASSATPPPRVGTAAAPTA